MIKEQFIPYNLALQLRDLGFDEECLMKISHSGDHDYFTKVPFRSHAWLNGEEIDFYYKFPEYGDKSEEIKIPLYQEAFDFFREEYKIDSFVVRDNMSRNYFYDVSWRNKKDKLKDFQSKEYIDYKEARQACLEKLIEIA